jgi:transposase
MGCLAGIRCIHVMRIFSERLGATGKRKKVAIAAGMCKILAIASAMARTRKPCDESLHAA